MGSGERRNAFLQWRRGQEIAPTDLVDRYGRVIGRGDLVMIPGNDQVIWQVVEVKVDLTPRPGVPTGVTLLQVILGATQVLPIRAGTPVAELLKVADYTETDLYQREQQAAKEKES